MGNRPTGATRQPVAARQCPAYVCTLCQTAYHIYAREARNRYEAAVAPAGSICSSALHRRSGVIEANARRALRCCMPRCQEGMNNVTAFLCPLTASRPHTALLAIRLAQAESVCDSGSESNEFVECRGLAEIVGFLLPPRHAWSPYIEASPPPRAAFAWSMPASHARYNLPLVYVCMGEREGM